MTSKPSVTAGRSIPGPFFSICGGRVPGQRRVRGVSSLTATSSRGSRLTVLSQTGLLGDTWRSTTITTNWPVCPICRKPTNRSRRSMYSGVYRASGPRGQPVRFVAGTPEMARNRSPLLQPCHSLPESGGRVFLSGGVIHCRIATCGGVVAPDRPGGLATVTNAGENRVLWTAFGEPIF